MKELNDNPDYVLHAERLAHCERVAEELGMADPDTQLYDRLSLELTFLAPFEVAQIVVDYACKWRKTRNPHYVDYAVAVCFESGIQISPTLQQVISEVALARVNGALSGTPEKIMRESAKLYAFRVMANLIFAGCTLKAASKKAAFQVAGIYKMLKPFKASTLEKEYVDDMRKPGLESEYFSRWEKHTEEREAEGSAQFWRDAAAKWPEVGSDLTGERR
ncbi:hypothetical protein CFI10_09450 [Marinobacterium iners]|uniref:hypothetical protein n=1 Tax=Marinobacterium iners TaxID=48076 RepID=UPI001A906471|nr:hypothetical protein [Marinobacterium iners]QSR35218.1 hypothetical protein CFI10_09450 [Marinobacterium iners]